ncbi:forkhead box protein R2 [Eulemur rufifrons]|uniref:forkhead box protein R2 n=1 Tax=Eulemur rufifrons TaxID=859984 RepID=UPI0037432BBE
MDLKLKNREFWYSLHGQVPGLLDWDMGNELFLPCTTDQQPLSEQHLSRYRLQVMEPPKVPLEQTPSPDKDGPHCEPNLWMWVNPNIVCAPRSQKAPKPSKKKRLTGMRPFPQLPRKNEQSNSSEATVVESLPCSSSEESPLQMQVISSSSDWDTEKETEEQEDNSSVALQSPNKSECLQSQELQPTKSQRRYWPRPPLNYSHLIALALKNGPSCGLNVQEIYNFTRQHFPFFCTAQHSWKNTIRHNLCFLGSFEKMPVSPQEGASEKTRSCLWRLTEAGHRRFQEETRSLASVRKESIKRCMSQPELLTSLFDI